MTATAIDLKAIQKELVDKLDDSGWRAKLYPYLGGVEFAKILEHLYKESKAGRRFTPKIKQLFTAFEECAYDDTKVVIIGQDSYPYPGIADGMAFSCSNNGYIQKSLQYMYNEIRKTVYNDDFMEYNPDLRCWANQGVLLLNCAFTTQVDKIGAHYDLWKEFLEEVLAIINEMSPVVFMLLGKKASEFKDKISDKHLILEASHPATAGYTRTFVWDSGDIFNKTNKFLKEHYNQTIKW
jgi:uracil-DNA glycosylase